MLVLELESVLTRNRFERYRSFEARIEFLNCTQNRQK